MFHTNTNRVCSRMAKLAQNDTPTMPVDVPKYYHYGEEEIWPYSEAYKDKYFVEEVCASASSDVPWQSKDMQSQSAGGIPGLLST